MARVVWGASGGRRHEFGLDRGVLYANNNGYPWNGLFSVEEHSSGGDVESIYVDGRKINEIGSIPDFEATVKSYGMPSFLSLLNGFLEQRGGMFVWGQPATRFGMSFRTLMSNDSGTSWYKIHLIYNALASTPIMSHTTMNQETTLEEYSWDITTLPVAYSGGWWPGIASSYLVINSERADVAKLAAVEDILYGTDVVAPRLPTPTELMALFA